MFLSNLKSAKFKKDLNFVWNNDGEHSFCHVIKFTEELDEVDKTVENKITISYQVCEKHRVFRKVPFDQPSGDNLILSEDWNTFTEEEE